MYFIKCYNLYIKVLNKNYSIFCHCHTFSVGADVAKSVQGMFVVIGMCEIMWKQGQPCPSKH